MPMGEEKVFYRKFMKLKTKTFPNLYFTIFTIRIHIKRGSGVRQWRSGATIKAMDGEAIGGTSMLSTWTFSRRPKPKGNPWKFYEIVRGNQFFW